MGLLGENESKRGCFPGENYTRLLGDDIGPGIDKVGPGAKIDGVLNDVEKLLGLGGKGGIPNEEYG